MTEARLPVLATIPAAKTASVGRRTSTSREVSGCRNEREVHAPDLGKAGPDLWPLVQEAVSRSDEADRQLVDSIISQCLDEPEIIGADLAARCVISGSYYFENIGDAERALIVAAAGLEASLALSNLQIQRQAHNTIGVVYSRVYDFERACHHLEAALGLARQLADPIAEFATLCNVVAILMGMGLMKDAYALSRRLLKCPSGNATLDSFHLQNAINGSKLAKFFNSISYVKRFGNLAKRKILTAGDVSEPWKAYVNANQAIRFLLQGDLKSAAKEVATALEHSAGINNIRVAVILADAQSAVSLALGEREGIKLARAQALSLLPRVERFPLHREDVLKMLVELYAFDLADGTSRATCIEFWRLLNEQLVKVRYRNFYERMASADEVPSTAPEMSVPSYALPRGLDLALPQSDLTHRGSETSSPPRLARRVQQPGAGDLCSAVSPDAADDDRLRSLRSQQYILAETWAVAAEFAVDHGGRHCFDVGLVAGKLAIKLCLPDARSSRIELACRLHDIGKIVLGSVATTAIKMKGLDEHIVVREHVLAGHRLLMNSNDPVLMLASQVSRSHHEYWNGCGYPDGLRGDEIPLESRICAVANAYVGFARPESPLTAWDDLSIEKQLLSMAGFQLDPGIVDALISDIKYFRLGNGAANRSHATNRLAIAKTKLVRSLVADSQS